MSKKHPGKFVGAHVSTAGGIENAPLNAAAIGATAFALFVKPQHKWSAPPIAGQSVAAFGANLAKAGIGVSRILPHAGYLINMASPDDAARAKSVESLVGELEKCRALSLRTLNIHPGSILKTGTREEGCLRAADSINRALGAVPDVAIVVENTSGQGSYLGSRFEELALILANVREQSRVGVCIDTAHTYGAGYDIAGEDGFARAFDDFGRIVGFGRLMGMHLNDTAAECGSHIDRHAHIGDGRLGWQTFKRIMDDPRFDGIPLILETPDPGRWADEIGKLGEI